VDQDQTLLLGASGDLANRLLLPGPGGLLPPGRGPALSLIGGGMEEWIDDHS
jgi:glucose-6-phosphate 1-dehydrogenase